MTIPTSGKPGLDELRRAGLTGTDDSWPSHWVKVGCYAVSVSVAGVPYMMVNTESSTNLVFEEIAPENDPAAGYWHFFGSIEEADNFVKVLAVKRRISE